MQPLGDQVRILHVDDEPDFLDVASTFLEREDERFEVETATDVTAGLERLANGSAPVDCVVSDYDMPGRNGIEFLEAVREAHPEVPFILYTGKGSEEVASEAISEGVTDYLQKESGTSQYAVLANRIRNAVEKYQTQAKLNDRERRLSLFFEQSPLGVIEWDEAFRLKRLNDAAEDILGYAEDDLVGKSWEAIVPESDREAVDQVVADLLEDRGGYHSVNENVRADGERVICEWHNRVVTDESDEVLAIFSQFQDVTERRQQQRRLETLIDNLPGLVYRCANERGWPMERVRGEVVALTGYEPAEIEGEAGFYGEEIVHPEDRDAVWAQVQAAVEAGEAFELTYRIRTKAGETRWVWERGRAIEGEEDTVEALEGFVTDITERNAVRSELRQEREFIDQALDAIDDVFYVLDTAGSVRRWNSRVAEVTGYTDEELGDMNALDVFPPDEHERMADAFEETLETGRAVVEADIRTKAGERITYELTGARLTDPDGEVIGLVGIGRSLDERD